MFHAGAEECTIGKLVPPPRSLCTVCLIFFFVGLQTPPQADTESRLRYLTSRHPISTGAWPFEDHFIAIGITPSRSNIRWVMPPTRRCYMVSHGSLLEFAVEAENWTVSSARVLRSLLVAGVTGKGPLFTRGARALPYHGLWSASPCALRRSPLLYCLPTRRLPGAFTAPNPI